MKNHVERNRFGELSPQLILLLLTLIFLLASCAPPLTASESSQGKEAPATQADVNFVDVTSLDMTSATQFYMGNPVIAYSVQNLPTRDCDAFQTDIQTLTPDILDNLPAGEGLCALVDVMLKMPGLSEEQIARLIDFAATSVMLRPEDVERICGNSLGCYQFVVGVSILPPPNSVENRKTIIHEECHEQMDTNQTSLIPVGDVSVELTESNISIFGTQSAYTNEVLADLCLAATSEWLQKNSNAVTDPAVLNYFLSVRLAITRNETDEQRIIALENKLRAAASWLVTNNALPGFLDAMRTADLNTAFTYLDQAFSGGASADPVHGLTELSSFMNEYNELRNAYLAQK